MKKLYLLILVVLVALAAGLYLAQQPPVSDLVVTDPAPTLPPAEPVKVPVVRYAVPEPEATEPAEDVTPDDSSPPPPPAQEPQPPLPSVDQSDAPVGRILNTLFAGKVFDNLLIVDSFIQRLVLTIDRLPEKKLPLAHIPLTLPEGKFLVSGSEGSLRTHPDNHQRYAPYVALLEQLDADQVIAQYIRLYPLLQTAYQQLGYPNAYFNDRLVYVIEHLLETPDPVDPIALEQPSVLYTYADPDLENLSAGQKILLRMGQQQRWKVLAILQNYHFRLTRLLPSATTP